MPDFKEGWPDVEHTSCNSTSHKNCLPNATGKKTVSSVFLLYVYLRNEYEFSIVFFQAKYSALDAPGFDKGARCSCYHACDETVYGQVKPRLSCFIGILDS